MYTYTFKGFTEAKQVVGEITRTVDGIKETHRVIFIKESTVRLGNNIGIKFYTVSPVSIMTSETESVTIMTYTTDKDSDLLYLTEPIDETLCVVETD